MFADVPLPPGLEYPPPLILRYFPNVDTFLEGLDTAEQACAANRYQRALQEELALMIRTSLAADFHWTHRYWWVGTPVTTFLQDAAATGLSSCPVIPIEVGVELPPIDASVMLSRCEEVRACPVRVLYVRSDAIAGGSAFFSYH